MSLRRDPRDILISSGDSGHDDDDSGSIGSEDGHGRHSSQSSIDLLVQKMLRGSRARRPTRRETTAMLLRGRHSNAHDAASRQRRGALSYGHRTAIHPSGATMHIDIEGSSSTNSHDDDDDRGFDDTRIQRGLASLTPLLSSSPAAATVAADHGRDTRRSSGSGARYERRRIARTNAADVEAVGSGPGLEGGVASARAKPRRKPDKAAQARLLHSVASTRAKQQEKYEKRKQKEAEAAAAHAAAQRRRHYSEVATKAGQRLYAMARTRAAGLQRLRDEEEARRSKEEAAVYTFKPVISAEAQRLTGTTAELGLGSTAASEAYRGPAERSADLAAATRAARQLRRLAAVHAELQACTFQPAITPYSRVLARQSSRNSHEPFEPGERLYLEGGERLLRRYIRRQLAMDYDQERVIGAGRTLSATEAHAVARRLQAWQVAHDRNMAELREESVRAARQTEGGGPQGDLGHRNQMRRASNSNGSSSVPRAASARQQQQQRTSTRARSQEVSPGQYVERRRRPSHAAEQAPQAAKHAALCDYYRRVCTASVPTSRSHHFTHTLSSGNGCDVLSSLPGNAASGSDAKALQDGLRFIRYGALFYKYAAPARAEVLRVDDVRSLVDALYPEDAGLLEALASAAPDEHTGMNKDSFVRALALYEQLHGPQPWGRSEKDRYLGAEPAPATLPSRTSSPQPVRRAASAAPCVRTQSTARTASTQTDTMRRDAHRASCAARSASAESEACTFTPRLSRRTRMLSERERRRRQARAAARQTSQPAATSPRRANRQDSAQPRPRPHAQIQQQAAANKAAAAVQGRTRASPRRSVTPQKMTEPSPGHSPSVELSSLSSSERTSEGQAMRRRASPSGAVATTTTTTPTTKAAAAAELEALLEPCVLPTNVQALTGNATTSAMVLPLTPQLSPVTRTETAKPPHAGQTATAATTTSATAGAMRNKVTEVPGPHALADEAHCTTTTTTTTVVVRKKPAVVHHMVVSTRRPSYAAAHAARLHPAQVTRRETGKAAEQDTAAQQQQQQQQPPATDATNVVPALQGDLAGDFSALYEALYHRHHKAPSQAQP